jgi:HK97 family phage portal protein
VTNKGHSPNGAELLTTGRYESVAPAESYIEKLHTIEGDGRRWEELPSPPAPGVTQEDFSTILTLYTANPWIYAAVNRTSSAVSSVRRIFYEIGPDGQRKRSKTTKLQRLLDRPNRWQVWEDLIEQTVIDLRMLGWSYWEKVLTPDGKTVALWRLRADRVKPIPDPDTYWSGIEFYRTPTDVITLGLDEFLSFRQWSPISDYYGVSGMFAAQTPATWDLYGRAWNTSVFRNGAAAMPEGVFLTKNRLDETTEKRIKAAIKNKIGHPDVWRDILILDNGLEFRPTAVSARDMQFVELMGQARDQILAAMGVPPAMVGVPVAGGLGGWREQRQQFYQITVLPLLRKIESTINRFLAPEGEAMAFDLSDILSLIEDLDSIASQSERLVTRGIRTINEIREEMGLEPTEWGNVWWAPLGLAPVEAPGRPARPEGLGGGPQQPGASPVPARPPVPGIPAPAPQQKTRKLAANEDGEARVEILRATQRGIRPSMARRIAGRYRRALDEVRTGIVQRFRDTVAGSRIVKAEPEEAFSLPSDFVPLDEGQFKEFMADMMGPEIKDQTRRAARAIASALEISFKDPVGDGRFEKAFDDWKELRMGSSGRTITDRALKTIEEMKGEDLTAEQAIERLGRALDDEMERRVADLSISDATTFGNVAEVVEGVAGGFTYKMWVTQEDASVRGVAPTPGEDHSVMHGVVVKIDDFFSVPGRGQEYLMFAPGDPNGGPEVTSRCRCSLVLLRQDEAEALEAG